MVVVQLPHDALAAAVGVQIYSFLCLLCSCLMLVLACKHRAKDSCEVVLTQEQINVFVNNTT